MEIELKNAADHFYPSHSLDLVYHEAVANAMDAGATEILIEIEIDSYTKPNTFALSISDNGCGFTSRNFQKFSKLLDVDASDHKGVGRLVYLHYFKNIRFVSVYNENKKREFVFNADFKGECRETILESNDQTGTKALFEGFTGVKINSYNQLLPEKIKEGLLDSFLPLLFIKKRRGESVRIKIKLTTLEINRDRDFYSKEVVLDMQDVPQLESDEVMLPTINMVYPFNIYYSIENNKTKPKKLTTKICVDGRALPLKLFTSDALPSAYQVFIMVMSEALRGNTNASRQSLELSNNITEEELLRALTPIVSNLISSNIKSIKRENKKTFEAIERKYPHLYGCYNYDSTIGIVSESQIVEAAQKNFFKRQKALLDKQDELSDEDFYTALEFSSRSLTEYILYRKMIIDRLSKVDKDKDEAIMHDIIVPRRKTYDANGPVDQYYANNVWLLDDKFMTYDVVMSEQTLKDILSEIGEVTDSKQKDRPDVAIFFSADPHESEKVNAVIVELKKYAIKLAKQEEVVSQLKQRARVLLKYHPRKIERMWYFGIAEMTTEFVRSLKEEEYRPLYSKGKAFYKQIKVMEDGTDDMHPIDLCIMDYETLLRDADARNEAFLTFLRKKIKSFKLMK